MRAEPHHRGLPYAWTLHFGFQGTNFTVSQTLTLASGYISTKAFVVVGGDVNIDCKCNVMEKYTEIFLFCFSCWWQIFCSVH